MIVIKDVPNQLGNRLFAFSSVIAFAAEKNISLYSRSFDDYKNYFPLVASDDFLGNKISTRFSKLGVIDFIGKKSIRVFAKGLSLLPIPFFVFVRNNLLLSLPRLEEMAKKKVVFVDSWLFPISEDIFIKQTALLKRLFRPDAKRMDNVERLVRAQRKGSNHLVIGVHRRLGDYATFLNGIYFFHDSAYLEKMRMLQDEIEQSGRTVSFLISSNDIIEPGNFKGVEFASCSGDFIEDMYALSKCDYIFGPPSTFSQWASFYGDVPLYLFKTSTEMFPLSEFSAIFFQDKFRNGKSFSHL